VNHGGSEEFSPSGLAERLRAAFGQHAVTTGWPWAARVRQIAPPPGGAVRRSPAIQVDLSSDDADALADLLLDAAESAASPDLPDPGRDWIGTARAAKMLDVAQSTIRGWVTRQGPKDNPFPQPERTDSGRNFWHKRTIRKWRARQRRLDQERREGR
jgi:hypothetical protein